MYSNIIVIIDQSLFLKRNIAKINLKMKSVSQCDSYVTYETSDEQLLVISFKTKVSMNKRSLVAFYISYII